MSKLAAVAAALLFASPVRACSVCFGGASSDMVRGFYWGVLLLGSLPFLLGASLFFLIVHHTKKNKTAPAPR